MKAVFSPGPSYSDPRAREFAGWVRILDLYKEGLEELGYEVFVPEVDPKLIDPASTVSKILSYDIIAAQQIPSDAELFLGPPGYSIAQMMAGRDNNWGKGMKNFLYVWNNADWWRDKQLAEEYKEVQVPYDLSPTWRWINTIALQMCNHIISCSDWVTKTHLQVPGITKDKISIAHWGVDSLKFSPPADASNVEFIEPPGFNVLFVGSEPIRKGLRYLVQAVVGLEGVELWIVGCKYLWEDTYGLKIREFGMLPYVDMPGIYQQCHVICIPTLEDGIALAIQEGMACGLVPVTSPETSEVFDDGISGYRVDYRDVEAIRKRLIDLRDHLDIRKWMSKEARKKAKSQTWETTKEQFKEVISREMRPWRS